jgi:hypothetical protein
MTPADKIELYHIIHNIKWRYKLDQFEDKALAEIMKSVQQARREIIAELNDKFADLTWLEERYNKELLVGALVGAAGGAAYSTYKDINELNKLTVGIKSQLEQDVSEAARIAYEQSIEAHNAIMSIRGRAVNVSLVQFAPEQLQSFLTTPIGGMQLSEWVQRTFDYPLQERLSHELMTGMFRGQSYKKLLKRIDELLGDAADNTETLVRSWVQAANTTAQHTVAKQNEDVIKGWRWDATLENGNFSRGHGTCLRCLALDARDEVYQMNGGPPLPLHPNCRCVRRYVTKSYRELGISLDDLNDAVRPYTTRGNIDPVTGTVKRGKTGTGGLPLLSAGRIDGGMDEFFKSLPEQLQKQTLGTRRYELWKDGQIKLYDLADENGDLKLVKEL